MPLLLEKCKHALSQDIIHGLSSADNIRYAKSAVGTRCFGVATGDDRGVVPALLPVADLLDHDTHNGCEWTSVGEPHAHGELPSLRIAAPLALPAGVLPSMSYGQRSNPQLLLSFGFCLHPNTADRFIVALAAEGQDTVAPGARQTVLRARGLSRRGSLSIESPLPEELLHTLRVCLAPEGDIYAASTDESYSLAQHRTELRLIATLRRALVQALSSVDRPGDAHLLTDSACEARCAVRVGATPGGQTIWGSDSPDWSLAAYRHGQASILRAALERLTQHAAGVLASIQPVTPMQGPNAYSDRFTAWLHASGARMPAFTPGSVAATVQFTPGGFWTPAPLKLAQDTAPGAILARIPAACILAASDELELARAIMDHAARGDTSPCAPMLTPLLTLPSPVEATCAAAALLQGSSASNAVEAEAEELGSSIDAMNASQERDGPGGAAWALAVVRHASVTCADGLLRLVPVVHALASGYLFGAVVNAQLADDGSGDVELIALAPLPADALLVSPVDSAEASALLLADAQPQAVHDENMRQHAVELMLAPPESDEHCSLRAAAMDAMSVGGMHFLLEPPSDVSHHRVITALVLITCDLGDHSELAAAAQECVDAYECLLTAERELDVSEGANVYVSPAQRAALAHAATRAADTWVASQAAVHGAMQPDTRTGAAHVLMQILEAMAEELGTASAADVQSALAAVHASDVWAKACAAHRDAQSRILRSWLDALRDQQRATPSKRTRE